MKPIFPATFLVAFSLVCQAAPSEAPVSVNTSQLPPHVAKRVQEAAAQGPAALRRYVAITRGIYNLDLQALATPAEASPATPARVAREAVKKTR